MPHNPVYTVFVTWADAERAAAALQTQTPQYIIVPLQ